MSLVGQPPDRRSTGRGVLGAIPFELLRASGFRWSTKAALFAMWPDADRNGWCWPSIATLAGRMGAHTETARRGIADLIAIGFITVVPTRGDTPYYQINIERILSVVMARQPEEAGETVGGAENHSGEGDTEKPPPYGKAYPPPTEKHTPPLGKTGGEGESRRRIIEGESWVPSPSPVLRPSEPTTETKINAEAPEPAPKRTRAKPKAESPDVQAVLALWVSLGLGPVSQRATTALRELVAEHGREWVEKGLHKASDGNISSPVAWLRTVIPGLKRDAIRNGTSSPRYSGGAGPPPAVGVFQSKVDYGAALEAKMRMDVEARRKRRLEHEGVT